MNKMLQIDVYWSFRSPWSYLATPRLQAWAEMYNLKVDFRPVVPIAIRTPEFFANALAQWVSYLMRDVHRVAEYLDLPFVWPNPDPVVTELGSDGKQTFPAEQPYIHRLTRLGVLAQEQGRGIEFANKVSGMIWGGQRQWDEGDRFADAVSAAGLELASMDRQAEQEADRSDQAIERNQQNHAAAGHWGVPTCVYEDEPFFGQDRLDVL
jgi:2-hydroxychromene-2-carboxylate isomerase